LSQNKVALLLAPGAGAVAVVMVLLRLHFQPPTVPAYTLTNSVDAEPVTVSRGGRFDLELRPTAPVTGAIGARGFLLQGDTVRPWDPPFTVDPDGAVHIAGPASALFAGVGAGAWDVEVAVGRPETLPTAPRDVLRARDATAAESARTASWRLVRRRIRLEE
jgi:hypothetical protein